MVSMAACCRTPLSHSIKQYNINKPSSLSLTLKPSPILFFRSQSSPFAHTISHILKHNSLSSCAPVIRASNDAFFSIETDNLSYDVRNRTMDAVDLCGRKVTIGDVASKAGIKVVEAQKALQAVAADSNAYLDIEEAHFDPLNLSGKKCCVKVKAKKSEEEVMMEKTRFLRPSPMHYTKIV